MAKGGEYIDFREGQSPTRGQGGGQSFNPQLHADNRGVVPSVQGVADIPAGLSQTRRPNRRQEPIFSVTADTSSTPAISQRQGNRVAHGDKTGRLGRTVDSDAAQRLLTGNEATQSPASTIVGGSGDRGSGDPPTIDGEAGKDEGNEGEEPRDNSPAPRERAPKKWEPLANHPVDISLSTFRSLIEYAVGQPVTLGVPQGRKHYFDEDVTGAILGSPRFLAYGAEDSTDIWIFSFWNKKLEKMDVSPSHVTTNAYLANRAEYTGVDERLFSRIIFADAEVKPAGKFTRDTIEELVNVRFEEIASSGIDMANVSHSQAERIVDAMREQSTIGNWRETIQLAIATSHIGDFIRMARKRTGDDLENYTISIADYHIRQELDANYRTDIDLLIAHALQQGIQELRDDGREEAAKHGEAWLSLHLEKIEKDGSRLAISEAPEASKQAQQFFGLELGMFSTEEERKSINEFTQDAVIRILNVRTEEIVSGEIEMGNVSHTQARRIIDVMRNQYASGNWQEAVALALILPNIDVYRHVAKEISDGDPSVITVADAHIGQELATEYRTDMDLLVVKALQQGVQRMTDEGRTEAATRTQAWLTQFKEKLTLDSFPPEITLDDIEAYPSYLHPRPDKGVPVIADGKYLTAGPGSRNLTIKYPDGSIYAVDYPTHGYYARSIQGHEEDGYRGNINDGTVRGFVHTDGEWLDFAQDVQRTVARELVDEAINKDTSFKKNIKEYSDVLKKASAIVDGQRLVLPVGTMGTAIKEQLAAALLAMQCITHTQRTVGAASSLFEYSVRGWGSKDKVEEETGISLTPFRSSLSDELKQVFTDFGNALYGYELANLAIAYEQHPEFAIHIGYRRTELELTQNPEHYYDQMMRAFTRLLQSDVCELVEGYYAGLQTSDMSANRGLTATALYPETERPPLDDFFEEQVFPEIHESLDDPTSKRTDRVSPEVRGFIAEMDKSMRRHREYNTPIIPMQLAIELWRMGSVSSFADFEKGLREMNSRVNFIAMPRETLKELWSFIPVNDWEQLNLEGERPAQTSTYQVVYPFEVAAEGEPEYWLWAEVNGTEEAAIMKERLGVTDEENAQRLKSTGVLALPSENNE